MISPQIDFDDYILLENFLFAYKFYRIQFIAYRKNQQKQKVYTLIFLQYFPIPLYIPSMVYNYIEVIEIGCSIYVQKV